MLKRSPETALHQMTSTPIREFFAASDFMEREVLRPLDHIRPHWELLIDSDTGRYKDEEDSFAWLFNNLVDDLDAATPPLRYHNSEDSLAEYAKNNLNWAINKKNGIWVNSESKRLSPRDYIHLLSQGGFKGDGDSDLIDAAAGRIKGAIDRGQLHFDDVEQSHQAVLGGVLIVILYHREPNEDWLRAKALANKTQHHKSDRAGGSEA